jgi:FkbM family methyltransferase
MSDSVLFQCPRREILAVKQIEEEYALNSFNTPRGWAPAILDVGAHVGSFALFAMHRWPGSTCTSYEPHPETYRLLVNNVQGLMCRTRNAAVVHPRTTAKVRLYEGAENEGRHACSTRDDVLWPPDAAHAAPYTSQQLDRWIDVDTFDAAYLEPCDVMKVDHEGGEDVTLRAYRHLRGVSILLVECHADRGNLMGQLKAVEGIAIDAGLKLVGQAGTVLRFVRQ